MVTPRIYRLLPANMLKRLTLSAGFPVLMMTWMQFFSNVFTSPIADDLERGVPDTKK